MHNSKQNPGVIILAAGKSSRMGQDKALLLWKGIPFIQHIVETFSECLHDNSIYIIVSKNKEKIQLLFSQSNIHFVSNIDGIDQLSSIQAGLRAISNERTILSPIFISPVDQPFVTDDFCKKMLELWQKYQPHALLPTYKGHGGHPILISSKIVDEIINFNKTGGLQRLFKEHSNYKLIKRVEINFPWILNNLNTPDTLSKLS